VFGVALAGGPGRRIGGSKAAVELAGRPLIDYSIRALQAVGLRTVVVAKAETPLPQLDVPVWIEDAPGSHPAYGIAAALARAESPIVALACDMPLVPGGLLEVLAGRAEPVVVPTLSRGIEPLPGRYSPTHISALTDGADGGVALRSIVADLDPHVLGPVEVAGHGDRETMFANVNRPGDLTRVERVLAETSPP